LTVKGIGIKAKLEGGLGSFGAKFEGALREWILVCMIAISWEARSFVSLGRLEIWVEV